MTQFKEDLQVKCESGDTYTLVGRPCEMSAFSFVPTERNLPNERTVFNSEKKDRYTGSTYDRIYHVDYGFNNKLHRCDREHAKSKGLTVNDEERVKEVPTLSSTIYGHKVDSPLDPEGRTEYDPLDPPNRKHVRVATVRAEFYRRNQIEGLRIKQAE